MWRNIAIVLIVCLVLTCFLPLFTASAQWAKGEVDLDAVDRWLDLNNYVAYGSSPGLVANRIPYAIGANSLTNGPVYNAGTNTASLNINGNASTATNATHATSATSATTATSATSASTASYATNAGTATTSNNTLLVNGYAGVRTASLVVAANDASALVKSQADYVCDGTADDVQIQAAIDALSTTGGVISLSTGTFYITTPIHVLTTGITIRGSGKFATILQKVTPATDSPVIDSWNTLLRLTIRDLQIDGNKANGTYLAGADGIRINNGSLAITRFLLVDNCDIYDCAGNGITCYGSAANYMDCSTISNNHIDTCNGNSIEINGENFSDFLIIGNRLFDPGNYNIYAKGLCTSEIIGNSIIGNPACTNGGIGLDDSGGYGFDVKVVANEIYSNGGNMPVGLYISAGFLYAYINNNTFNACTVAINNASSSSTIYRNKGYVTENSGTGTILNTATSAVITHGLSITPTLAKVKIIGLENPTNDTGNIWLSSANATAFTVNVKNDPGASNWDFGWSYAE